METHKSYVRFEREPWSWEVKVDLQDGSSVTLDLEEGTLEDWVAKQGICEDSDKALILCSYVSGYREVFIKPATGEIYVP